MAYKSSYDYVPNAMDNDADLVYLNMDIINNRTSEPGLPSDLDPQIRFVETRDAAILKDASKYQFSVVRFTMAGANKDLPLFIPSMKTQGVPPVGILPENWTEYELAIAYQQDWLTSDLGVITIEALPAVRAVNYEPETQNPLLAPIPRNPQTSGVQDLSTRYYWVYTYSHWIDLVNFAFDSSLADTYAAFQAAWVASGTTDAFPFASYTAFKNAVGVPYMTYDENSGLFSLYGDERAYGTRLSTFTPPGPPVPGTAQANAPPQCRLFFDTNMMGLFSNFNNIYYGGPTAGLQGPFYPTPTPSGYANEIIFTNKHFTNIQDLSTTTYVPASNQHIYWVLTQDYESTSSLWSPVASIVFTTSLLPIRNEATGKPITFGTGNLGASSASIENAFQPILTDIALDLANEGGDGYRKMIYYAPVAEYRMASLTRSKQPINSVDITVFWKNRLDGQLYPLQMYNLSSVSIKALFRRIRD
jgi:hypothetical protein